MLERPLEGTDFGHHEEACVRRQELRDCVDGGMGAVGRRECIIDIDLAKFGQALGKLRIIAFFPAVVAKVLEDGYLARPERSHAALRFITDAIANEMYGRLAHQLLK